MSFWTGIRDFIEENLGKAASVLIPGSGPVVSSISSALGGGPNTPAAGAPVMPQLGGGLSEVPYYGFDPGPTALGELAPNVVTVPGSKSSDPIPWNAILGATGAIGSGALSYFGQQRTNSANAAQALQQQNFQAAQTGTAYQRGVADMQAAGLNPMLAYSQGGASSGSGSAAVMQNSLGMGVSSALQGATTMATFQNLLKTGKNIDADTSLKDTQAALNEAHTPAVASEIRRNIATAGQAEAATNNILADLERVLGEAKRVTGSADSQIAEAAQRAIKSGFEAQLTGLDIPRAQNEAKAQNAPLMQNSPYIKVLLDILRVVMPRGLPNMR